MKGKYKTLPESFNSEKYRKEKEDEGGIVNSFGIIRMPNGDIDVTLLFAAFDEMERERNMKR